MSYWAAVPLLPSSPGAVQVRSTLVSPGLPAARSVMAAGGVVSAGAWVVAEAALETADQLGTSSAVLRAKW